MHKFSDSIRSNEGIDFIPANIGLSGIEVGLVTQLSREKVLNGYVDTVRDTAEFQIIFLTLFLRFILPIAFLYIF